jgi:PAS domain-containing protein
MAIGQEENYLEKIEELESRLADAEQLIEAIKAGEVDAFAVRKDNQSEIFTLQSGDYAYRILVENFSGGAINITEDGLIVYSNKYFHEMLGLSYDKVVGGVVHDFIHPASKEAFSKLFTGR